MADIATVITTIKATALNVQTNAMAGAKASADSDAKFGALLQQLAQPATPANDAGQPAALNDNADAQTDPVAQTELQATPQTPRDISKLIALLRNAAPQQVATSQPQSDVAVSVTNPATGTTSTVSDTAAKNDPKNASDTNLVKNDAKTAQDAEPTAKSEPRAAPDANLVVALAQQAQAAIQIQPAAENAVTAAIVVSATPAATNTKPTLARVMNQAGKDSTANSAKLAAATDALKTDAADSPNASAPQADTPKAADGIKSDANADAAPALPASAHDATPAPTAQSSASGQSANTSALSVAAATVQAPAYTASSASADVNLQVAPLHRDATPTATMDTLGLTIAAKSADGIKHFDIRLDPPELGRVEIHLSLDDSGKAQANLVVDKPQTLELLQRDAANLTHSLNDAGVSLSNNGLNFSLRGQDRQSDSGSVVKGRSRALSVKAVVGTDAISNSSSIASLAPDSVRLDIRV